MAMSKETEISFLLKNPSRDPLKQVEFLPSDVEFVCQEVAEGDNQEEFKGAEGSDNE